LLYQQTISTPINDLVIVSNEAAVLTMYFPDEWKNQPFDSNTNFEKDQQPAIMQHALAQLQAYFAGQLLQFELPMEFIGTAFQQKVWQQLLSIPFAKTISYLQLSKQLGDAKAIRAVGTANGSNPIAIVVPCHRVIGSNGSLVGYGGGLWRKQWLLQHEAKIAGVFQQQLFQ
jgi:methylated-DNA-[protein]-cysteine S-methyltransferase